LSLIPSAPWLPLFPYISLSPAGWQAHKNAPDARKKPILDLDVYDLFPFALSALNFECKSAAAADDYLQNAVKGARACE
jgi:hypothetical protein